MLPATKLLTSVWYPLCLFVTLCSFLVDPSHCATFVLNQFQPILNGNEAAFRSIQTSRYSPNRSSLHVVDVVELFLLESSVSQIETYLSTGCGQHRFSIDVAASYGGFYVSSTSKAFRNAPMPLSLVAGPAKTSNDLDDGNDVDLMVMARFKMQQHLPPSTLLTVSLRGTPENDSISFYQPILSITIGDDRLMIEYSGDREQQSSEPVRIPIPVRVVDDKWHSLVVHWSAISGDDGDDFYVWVDCQLIYQGVAVQPSVLNSENGAWLASVGTPTLPATTFIDELPAFAPLRSFNGLVEQLVITRDRLFWQSDEQCRYQRETSAVKNNCPICTSPTFLANSAIKSAQTKLLTAIGRNKQKLSQEFDTIKEQLGAALRRIEFLELLQKHDQELGDAVGKCFERSTGRYYAVNDTWTVDNCTRQCACLATNSTHLTTSSVRPVCTPLKCSPSEVADCPPFPYGGVVWDLADGCCPRCLRRSTEESMRHSGRPCVRWHRSSSVPHGALFFIRLENDTCAEKRCIDGRETVVRQGHRSMFCGNCLKNASLAEAKWQRKQQDGRTVSRQVCCGADSLPCKVRSCHLNASSVCDSSDRAICEDTDDDIVCHCRVGYIGDGSRCIDVDECQEPTGTRFSANCTADEVCINTQGSFHCVQKTEEQLQPLLMALSSQRIRSYIKPTTKGLPRCDDQSEILVRYSPSMAMCHCLPGFARLRPSILMAFARDNLPTALEFNRNDSTHSVHVDSAQRCFDIDECQQLSSPCSDKHHCANIPGSYVCISSSYTAHEAHEIKLTANARRSAQNGGSHIINGYYLTSFSFILIAVALVSIF